MIYVKKPPTKHGDYIYDPKLRKIVQAPEIKKKKEKAIRRSKYDNNAKHRRNMIGLYPGYIFTLNGVGYICVDGGNNPPTDNLIPVRVYPMPDRLEHLSKLKEIPRSKVTRGRVNRLEVKN